MKVLVVDDERDSRDVVAGIMALAGVETDLAGNAREALKLLGESSYDGVIIDLAMPEINGLELVQYIRQMPRTSSIPAVAITAYHNSLVRRDASAAGFHAYFPKPLSEYSFPRDVINLISAKAG